ncbi:hypothetical protein G7Z17_g12037 [Cylindrodendrum hubeiense]|uniref:Uncharacterized protein n=1 Tax=Cylindrodendrum hubeiense TaxID=595255 RepID=A0A9P5L5U6_9HYPO|nr:hypothetical protein G7Z17_g12037 [Cylindrodendrum hubeiense]
MQIVPSYFDSCRAERRRRQTKDEFRDEVKDADRDARVSPTAGRAGWRKAKAPLGNAKAQIRSILFRATALVALSSTAIVRAERALADPPHFALSTPETIPVCRALQHGHSLPSHRDASRDTLRIVIFHCGPLTVHSSGGPRIRPQERKNPRCWTVIILNDSTSHGAPRRQGIGSLGAGCLTPTF